MPWCFTQVAFMKVERVTRAVKGQGGGGDSGALPLKWCPPRKGSTTVLQWPQCSTAPRMGGSLVGDEVQSTEVQSQIDGRMLDKAQGVVASWELWLVKLWSRPQEAPFSRRRLVCLLSRFASH